MWIKGVVDRVERDVEVRQAVEDLSELRYRVLFGKLLTARHFGEPLSAENPVEELLLLVKTCYETWNSKNGLRIAPGFFFLQDFATLPRGERKINILLSFLNNIHINILEYILDRKEIKF